MTSSRPGQQWMAETEEATGQTESQANRQAAVGRSAIADHHKWNLERVYPDWSAWEADFAAIEAALPGLAGRQGTLDRGAEQLLQTIEAIMAIRRKLEVVAVFASMKSDEDTRIGENTGRLGRARTLSVRFGEAVSWFQSEMLKLDPHQLSRWLAENEKLGLYGHYIDDIQRSRPHTLSPKEEALLASAAEMARGPNQVFSALNNADLKFPSIQDEEGRTVELTKARYTKYLKSSDRRVRQDAYRAFMDTYGAVINTLAATMDANIKSHVFYARSRHHQSSLDAALHSSAIPLEVFHTLVETTHANLETVHRYTEMKKRVLDVEPLWEHDLYVPLFPEAEFTYSYEEAQQLLLEALAPLGEEYLAIVREGFSSGWIDVHENLGKRSGAYSSGVYDTSPYILLNWSDQLRDTFTLAHEMGHSIHTYLASKHQPYVYGDYPIFTAEVASTLNEMLLMDYLLRRTTGRERKLYLLDHQLTQINDTVFRQTMFAEYEHAIHRLVEDGETLTSDLLAEKYVEKLKLYWGPAASFDEERSGRSWSRIPHFYYNYYVYQYATAYAAATALSRKILSGDDRARVRYLEFLSSGDSRYPVDTLKTAGVDMTRAAPIADVIEMFGSLLDETISLWVARDRTEAGS